MANSIAARVASARGGMDYSPESAARAIADSVLGADADPEAWASLVDFLLPPMVVEA